ncbi:hypothetical protein V8C37DRAFT_410605 [Trichoderma ceciliae]
MAHHRHRCSSIRSTAYHQDQGGHFATLPSASNNKCTSSRADLIPSWLQHVQASCNDSSGEVPRQASPSPVNLKESSWHPNGLPTVRIQSFCDAGGYQSSDVFIQDSPSSQSPRADQIRHHHRQSDPSRDCNKASVGGEGYDHSNKLMSTPPEATLIEDPVFEKRPRRKTRQDRYSTIKPKAERRGKGQTRRSSTRVSNKGRRLRSSREVMANFKSSAIANPNERITGCSSMDEAPCHVRTSEIWVNTLDNILTVANLVFNDVILRDEDVRQGEKEQLSIKKAKKLKREKKFQEEIDLSGRASSNPPSADFQSFHGANTVDHITVAGKADITSCHGGSDNNGANQGIGDDSRSLPRHRSRTSHSGSICSLPAIIEPRFSDSNTLNKLPSSDNSNSRQDTQRNSTADQKGVKATLGHEKRKLDSRDTIEPPKYEDKGVMVSPWIRQRTEERESNDKNSGDYQLWPKEMNFRSTRAEPRTTNVLSQIPPAETNQGGRLPHSKALGDITSIESQIYGRPSYLPRDSERPKPKTEIKDTTHLPSDLSPAWFFDRTSTCYPDLASFDYFGSSQLFNSQSRDVHDIDFPAQPTTAKQVNRLSQEAFQDSNVLSSNTSQAIDDIPGESLKEYIERMEREILGVDEPSMGRIDDSLLSAEAIRVEVPRTYLFGDGRYPDDFQSKNRFPPRDLLQRPITKDLGWPLRQYQRLPAPAESPDHEIESELASFWRPNHMMWC